MLARTILVLSLLLSTRVQAQSAAPAAASQPSGSAVATSAPTAAGTSTPATAAAIGTGATDVKQTDSVPTSSPRNTGIASSAEVKSAVPVNREALVAAPAADVPRRDLESDPMFTPSVVLIGGGSAVLLASLFTGLGAHGIYKSLEADCKNNICPGDKAQRISSGKALALVSTVLTGVGIAAVGVGTTLLILAANRNDEPPATANFGFAKVTLTGGPTPLGLGATATF